MANAKTVSVLAGRDLSRIMRDKAFLFIVASQLLILSVSVSFSQAFPAFLAGEVATPEGFARIGVGGADPFWQAFRESGKEGFVRIDIQGDIDSFARDRFDALVFARDFEDQARLGLPVVVDAYIAEGPKASLISYQVRDVLEDLDQELRISRLADGGLAYTEYRLPEDQRRGDAPAELIYTAMLPLFILFICVVAGNMMITLLSFEVEEKTLEPLLATPVSAAEVVAAKATVAISVVASQLIVWIAVFEATDIDVAHPLLLLFAGCVYVAGFTALGHLAFSLAKNRDGAQNIYAAFILPGIIMLLPFGELPPALEPLLSIIPSRIIAHLALSPTIPPDILAGLTITTTIALGLLTTTIQKTRQDTYR